MDSSSSTSDAPPDRHLVVETGGRWFGIPLSDIREIVPFDRAARLPGAPAATVGLLNVRGTIVTALDLGLLASDTPARRAGGSVVLVQCGARVAGLVVDAVLDLHAVEPGPPAPPDRAARRPGIGGAGRLGAQVVHLIETDALMSEILL